MISTILVMFFCIGLSQQFSCFGTQNCYCEEFQLKCVINKCLDRIPIQNVERLIVFGQLCPEHKTTLQHLLKSTQIILMNDLCPEGTNCM